MVRNAMHWSIYTCSVCFSWDELGVQMDVQYTQKIYFICTTLWVDIGCLWTPKHPLEETVSEYNDMYSVPVYTYMYMYMHACVSTITAIYITLRWLFTSTKFCIFWGQSARSIKHWYIPAKRKKITTYTKHSANHFHYPRTNHKINISTWKLYFSTLQKNGDL